MAWLLTRQILLCCPLSAEYCSCSKNNERPSDPCQPKQLVRLFASGLLFGIGALMKQPGLLFIPFGAICIVWNDVYARLPLNKILRRILIFATGAAVPLGVTSLILWRTGVFDTFWFWTINYAWQYGSLVPVSQAPQIFLSSANDVVLTAWPIWMLACIGALTVFGISARVSAYCFSLGFSPLQGWRCARDFIFERITSSSFCRQYRFLLPRQSAI